MPTPPPPPAAATRWLLPSAALATVSRTCAAAVVTTQRRATNALFTLARPLTNIMIRARNCTLDYRELALDDPFAAVLGLVYDLSPGADGNNSEREAFLDDCRARVLLTYRRNFLPIRVSAITRNIVRRAGRAASAESLESLESGGSAESGEKAAEAAAADEDSDESSSSSSPGPTSDAGWGCCVRATQMALAQCLLQHRLGRRCRPAQRPNELRAVLANFCDCGGAALSVHNIASVCSVLFGTGAAAWSGPTGCARAAELVAASGYFALPLRLLVFPEGLVARSKVLAMQRLPRQRSTGYISCQEEDFEDEENMQSCTDEDEELCPLVIVVCTMLGSNRFNSEKYTNEVRRVFELHQCCGAAGGSSDTSAAYFYGSCAAGLLFLDPHVDVKPAFLFAPADLDEFFELKARAPFLVPWDRISPSMAFYFLIKNQEDVDELLRHFAQSGLFEVVEEEIDFAAAAAAADTPVILLDDDEEEEEEEAGEREQQDTGKMAY